MGGMNDLTTTMCSEQVTVMGVLRVVEELHEMRPESTIVINSILPKAASRHGKILDGRFVHNKYYDAIEQVNSRLKNFASKQGNRVRFYDADTIFVSKSKSKTTMNMNLFSDTFHPNAEGHRRWGEAQMKVISNILTYLDTEEKDKSENEFQQPNDMSESYENLKDDYFDFADDDYDYYYYYDADDDYLNFDGMFSVYDDYDEIP